MADRIQTLVRRTTTGEGSAVKMPGKVALVQAYLNSAGTSATVVLYGKLSDESVWTTIATFTLSGASDHAEWLIDNEPWGQLKAEITAISSATATVEVGF